MKKYILLKNVSTNRYKLKEVEAEEIDNNCFVYILDDEICINDGLTGMLVCKGDKNNEEFLLPLFYSLVQKLNSLRKTRAYYNRACRYNRHLKKL